MRVFEGQHPNWSGPVHIFDDGTMCRPGFGAGRYELEPGRLILRWNQWAPEPLDWDVDRAIYVGKGGAFVLREVEEDTSSESGTSDFARLVVGILACADERFASRRERCLETWIPPLVRAGATVVFLVGVQQLREPRLVTSAEHGRLGLELQLPCPDDYASLPRKTREFVRWAVERCEFDRLLKCDDDTYLVPKRLADVLASGLGDYVGHRLPGGVPYASGGAGYLLSRRAAEVVREHLGAEDGCEDVLVGRALQAGGIGVTHDPRFVPFGTDDRRPRPNNDFVTSHAFTRAFELHRTTWAESPDEFDGRSARRKRTTATDPGARLRPGVSDHGYWVGDAKHVFDESLARELATFFGDATVLDLGCGAGAYVMHMREHGIECDGYDGNPWVDRMSGGTCGRADLATRCEFGVRDWVLSLEVGEHLPARHADTYVDNLHRHNRRGIVVSWAIPGQGGMWHVNERSNGDVRAMIEPIGYEYDEQSTQALRDASTRAWFRNSLLVFRRSPSLADLP